MSDELLDKLDVWGRAQAADAGARSAELPLVRLMGEVRHVRRVRAAATIGIVAVALTLIVTLAALVFKREAPRPAAAVAEPPVRAIDR